MIDINPETIRFIIARAHELQSDGDSMFNESQVNPLEGELLDIRDTPQFDTTDSELKTVVNDLEPDQQQTIVALMWLGRGDFSLNEWEEALEAARDNWTPQTAEYLIGTTLLADYLSEGLAMHGYTED